LVNHQQGEIMVAFRVNPESDSLGREGVVAVTLAPDMAQYTGYLLRRAFARSAQAARDCVPDDSTIREVAFLSVLAERGPLSQRALSDLTHVNPTVVVRLVDTLEAKGWVIRERSRLDRRQYAVSITTAGRTALHDFEADLDEGEAALTADLTVAEVDRLRGHLRTLLTGDAVLEVSSLVDRTGYLIAHAHRSLRRRAETALAELSLHPRDFGLLSIVARDQPCSQNHVAAALGVSPPAALVFVEELEQRGLLTRSRSAVDRRVYDVRLTDRGRAALIKATRTASEIQQEIAEALGPDADEDLRHLLTKLLP